jgi:hydroxymethylbilane synthase
VNAAEAAVKEPTLRLGTRGSALALAQAKLVAKALGNTEIVPIKTSGDGPAAPGTTAPGEDKSRFVREIEHALLVGEVDLGVHSAKDLPTDLPEGLEIAGVLERADPRDAYVGDVDSLGECPPGARIGTSSLRRRAQILARRPDLEVVDLRGNVDTRLGRFEAGDFDGLVLAAAGLYRLGRADEIAFPIERDEMTPAAGQGTIAIEAAHTNDVAAAAAESITDRGAFATLAAERALVAELDASCNTPLGANAEIELGARMHIRAFCGLPDGSEWLRDELTEDDSNPEALGRKLGERLRAAGAADILERAEEMVGRGRSAGEAEERPVS